MADDAPARRFPHQDHRLRALEQDHRSLELQVTGTLAEIKIVLSQLAGDVKEGIAELKVEVAGVKAAVSAGALADVERESRIKQLEEATKEAKDRRAGVLKWAAGIIASLITAMIAIRLGLK